MSNEITIIEQRPLSAGEIQNQVNVIQHVMKQVMKKDVHYGVIPGCNDPCLYKPGAEKIMATFRLSAEPEVKDLSTEDKIRYQVTVRLVSPSGHFVGAGVGECSSGEEKYKWRRAVCDEEFSETEPGRKREKWCRGYKGRPNYKLQQVRTEPDDLANTILKMAKKRALVDAVLTATAASDCFTQDIDDLPPEYVDGEAAPPRQPARQQQRTGSPGQQPIGPEHLEHLKKMMEMAGVDEAYVCREAQVNSLADIQQARLAGVNKLLQGLAQGKQNDNG